MIVVAVCALPFVFLGTSSLSNVFTGSYGSINGEDVSESDIQIAANTAVQRFKNIYGESFDFDELDEDLRSESIKQELIVQKVLQSGARSLGFINDISVREAQKGIIRSPQFQIEGRFDESVFEAQVNSNGFTKEGYLNIMTNLYATEIYRDSLSKINFVTDEEINILASLLEQSADIKFTKISYSELKDQVNNTLEELIEYYENNEIDFYTNERRGFQYFLLDQSDYRDLVEVPENYIELAYQDYINNFEASAEIRFSHIMIEKGNYVEGDEALEAIKTIESKLNSGESFESLASQFSEDIITKDTGGDLEYFEKDIFPVEFDKAISNLGLNDISEIIELDETYHILKVTEFNQQNPIPEQQIKDELLKELIDTESFALMNDDFSELDDMLMANNSLEEIAETVSKELLSSELYSEADYEFEITSEEIKAFLFARETQLNSPIALEISDRVIFIAMDRIEEPLLKEFDSVIDEVGESLSEIKAIEKISLLQNELDSIQNIKDKESFINSYDYITNESYVDVKRYSSLLPNEVLSQIFNEKKGTEISAVANNRDVYSINLINFNKLTEEELLNIASEYNDFAVDRSVSKMQEIINEDVFQNAKVNLNNALQL